MPDQRQDGRGDQQAKIGTSSARSCQYVAIAAYFQNESFRSWPGHFNQQAMEERTHAMKFVNYVLDAGGLPEIPAIPAAEIEVRKRRGGREALAGLGGDGHQADQRAGGISRARRTITPRIPSCSGS